MTDHGRRLDLLRTAIAAAGGQAYVVPLTDEHGSEYVIGYARRLEWLTGFTGSQGWAAVTGERAAIFVDGRYIVQAEREVDRGRIEVIPGGGDAVAPWLAANAVGQQPVLFDPWLHDCGWVDRATNALAAAGIALVPAPNLIDTIWTDRPAPPAAPAVPHPLRFAGREASAKRAQMAAEVASAGADALVLTALDSIAWLLNIRGTDLGETPVVRSFLLLRSNASAMLFVDPGKINDAMRDHLGSDVECAPYGTLATRLGEMGTTRVMIDPDRCPAAVRAALGTARIIAAVDPCLTPRAIKNPVEIAGMRRAHQADGIAVVRFLIWLESAARSGNLDEIAAADRLDALRRKDGLCRGLSAATISAAGANAALPHYLAKPGAAALLRPGSVYLLDGGGQYLDGTTDITRTVAIGDPAPALRRDFTLALKAHLAIATLRFPAGTTGGQLDPLARQPLWRAGLDYPTGTGHGLGSYLAIHEGPAFFGKPGGTRAVDAPLRTDMVMTIEPGIYRVGQHGVRTENAYRVVPATGEGGAAGWHAFEPLSMAPIDRRLIDTALLDAEERAWIDRYHAAVVAALADALNPPERAWLEKTCAPLD